MNEQDIKDIIYFLSINYNYQGCTDEMLRQIKKLSLTIYVENIQPDKELMIALSHYPNFH